jgi:hypothetical protein
MSPAAVAERRDVDALTVIDAARVGRIFREESGRSVATLIRVLGDIDLAEDAVQDAFAIALRRWPERACRRTRAGGSRRPHAIRRSTACGASPVGASCSPSWRWARMAMTRLARPRTRRDPWTTIACG